MTLLELTPAARNLATCDTLRYTDLRRAEPLEIYEAYRYCATRGLRSRAKKLAVELRKFWPAWKPKRKWGAVL